VLLFLLALPHPHTEATSVFPMLVLGTCSGTENTGSFWGYAPEGWRGTGGDNAKCLQCPEGHYMGCPAGNSAQEPGPCYDYGGPPPNWNNVDVRQQKIPCTKCPAGTFQPFRGANSSTSCLPCLPGTASWLPGADACSPCSPGTWSGARACYNASTLPSVPIPVNCSMRDFPSSEVVGGVLDTLDVASENACRAECCGRGSSCLGFSFYKPLVSFPRCTLLGENVTYVVPTNLFVSSVRSNVLGF
jgi:hypothetical protein